MVRKWHERCPWQHGNSQLESHEETLFPWTTGSILVRRYVRLTSLRMQCGNFNYNDSTNSTSQLPLHSPQSNHFEGSKITYVKQVVPPYPSGWSWIRIMNCSVSCAKNLIVWPLGDCPFWLSNDIHRISRSTTILVGWSMLNPRISSYFLLFMCG